MGQANTYFDSKDRKYKIKGFAGEILAEVSGAAVKFTGDVTSGINTTSLKAGSGTAITKMGVLTGTLLPLAAVGTGLAALSTISNMTGLAIGDKVSLTFKAAVGGNLLIGNPHIPTTNTLCVYVLNPVQNSAGSLVAVGVDVKYDRS